MGTVANYTGRRTRIAHLADACATWVIKGGGLLVIAATVGILLLITTVALPLFYSAGVQQLAEQRLSTSSAVLAAGSDEHLQTIYSIETHGRVTVHNIDGHSVQSTYRLRPASNATITAVGKRARGTTHSSVERRCDQFN